MQTLTFLNGNSVRLDSFLLESYPLLSFGKISKFLKENKIKVNNKKVPLNTILIKGDVISLYILDEYLAKPSLSTPLFLFSTTEIEVIYEDENVLIVNKPSGIISEDENNKEKNTLINIALHYLYNKKEYDLSSSFIPALCHRLDTGTQGLIIIAKNQKSLDLILDLLKQHKIIKEYRCITFGIPTTKQGTIKNYLLKDSRTGTVMQYNKQIPNSKEAITKYNVLATSGRFALINVELFTGRTHQIRVHMAKELCCPILGDNKYGNNDINKELKVKYQELIAYKITFPQINNFKALSNKTIEINSISFQDKIFNHLIK